MSGKATTSADDGLEDITGGSIPRCYIVLPKFAYSSFFFPILFFASPRSVCLWPLCVGFVVLDPPPGQHSTAAGLLFVVGFLSLTPFCLLAFRLVFLRRPYVGPSAGHTLGLIVPANSNLVLGTRPAP